MMTMRDQNVQDDWDLSDVEVGGNEPLVADEMLHSAMILHPFIPLSRPLSHTPSRVPMITLARLLSGEEFHWIGYGMKMSARLAAGTPSTPCLMDVCEEINNTGIVPLMMNITHRSTYEQHPWDGQNTTVCASVNIARELIDHPLSYGDVLTGLTQMGKEAFDKIIGPSSMNVVERFNHCARVVADIPRHAMLFNGGV